MTRNIYLTLSFLFLNTILIAQTCMLGKITDAENGEVLIGANVILKQNDVFKLGTSTDFDGNYSLSVDPGTYDVEVSYIGFPSNTVIGMVVNDGQANLLNVQMKGPDLGINLNELIVVEYKVPLLENDYTHGCGVDKSQIRNLPTKDIDSLAAQTRGLSSVDQGNGVSLGSGRSGNTSYYIDGKLVSGKLVSQSDIEKNRELISKGTSAAFENNSSSPFRPSFNFIRSTNSQSPNR